MNAINTNEIKEGDKIVLKTDLGPEGAKNSGIVEEIRESGVLVDFGLTYAYVIPFNFIKTHLKLIKKEANKPIEASIKRNKKQQLKL